jgi:hypothetical protein
VVPDAAAEPDVALAIGAVDEGTGLGVGVVEMLSHCWVALCNACVAAFIASCAVRWAALSWAASVVTDAEEPPLGTPRFAVPFDDVVAAEVVGVCVDAAWVGGLPVVSELAVRPGLSVVATVAAAVGVLVSVSTVAFAWASFATA